MVDGDDSKWRDGFLKGFLAATDAVKQGYAENDLRAFADHELKEWLGHPAVRKWPPRISDTRKPTPPGAV